MPTRCVAAWCSNTHSDGVSLFRFPRDPVLKEQWVKQVQRTRAQWKPSESSVLCSKHFTDDCFEVAYDLATQFGIKKTRKLKPGAVPSLFLRKRPQEDDQSSPARKRSAVEKRERSRVRH